MGVIESVTLDSIKYKISSHTNVSASALNKWALTMDLKFCTVKLRKYEDLY